ncbi:hypothetical protein MMC25_004176 [Agyrium rufum]|nr:hypothetical protein [Agyrium rufum]
MATVVPYSSPARTPFGSIDDGRLRNLSNVKNRQNVDLSIALSQVLNTSGKRRAPEPSFDEVDSENIDPSTFSPSKKSKNFDGFPVKPYKAPQFVLTKAAAIPAPVGRTIITPKRIQKTSSNSTPAAIKIPQQPASAPASTTTAPAGRSPKSRRIGILSRRRVSSSPFTRINPPSFGLSNGTAGALPFSIDAALSGTVSSYKPQHVSTIEESMPKSWDFPIYEDTPEEHAANLMEHSALTLDISSDDECKKSAKNDRGKENVPPGMEGLPSVSAHIAAAYEAPVSRKNMMTDEPRTPLGDLEAQDFYADGCDASSFVIIPAEKEVICHSSSNVMTPTEKPTDLEADVAAAIAEINNTHQAATASLSSSSSSSPVEASTSSPQEGWQDILSQFDAEQRQTKKVNLETDEVEIVDEAAASTEIEIWESESAKGDGEEGVFVGADDI